MSVLPACQKRTSNVVIDGHKPPSGCWESNLGPLEEQPELLTSMTLTRHFVYL